MTSTTNTEPNSPGERPRQHQDGVSDPSVPAPEASAGAGAPPAENKSLKRLQNYSMRNMIYSLVAVFALVFVVWALMPNSEEQQRRPVEVGMVASYAAQESAGPVWSTQALGEDWSANFANFELFDDVLSWRVGLVTPSTEYVEISQADEATDSWVGELTDKAGDEVGTRTITGPDGPQEWTAYEGEERAVVLGPGEGRENTTVVRGTAQWDEIEEFIGLLEPVEAD
ncbi:DUF4245 family protein [Ornithinimicrobium faecis]|uniref:DUF4245 family protein n=1 Tax=Ornithinimicrobium faecis TaxID=2934158 RepID=UPI002118C78C|nr:DUF4245 family protein [Ornithinimicrobium sp. HY1745]